MEQKPIPGFEPYSVFADGRVYSSITHRFLKPETATGGYLRVVLCGPGGARKKALVHRLVACAFVPGDHSLTVNHRDGDKTNNVPENLEWMGVADNLRHAHRTGLNRGGAASKGVPRIFSREAQSAMFADIRSGQSIRSVAIRNGVKPGTLWLQYKQAGAQHEDHRSG
jgi:hypothetical protein